MIPKTVSRHTHTRRDFLKTVGSGAASLALHGCGNSSQKQVAYSEKQNPNIILILVDDLGWIDTSCYGSRFYETLHIDSLAAQGMRFTDGYAACAVCSPTRAAVMTGRYPARLGVTDWIRARFQGGTIPEDRKNPIEYVGGNNRKLLCPPNALWMELDEVTIAEAVKPAEYNKLIEKEVEEISSRYGELFKIWFDHVVIAEDIAQGERVRQYKVEALIAGDQWREICEGISIGHKRTQTFDAVEASRACIRVVRSTDFAIIRELSVYSVA